MLSTFNLNFFFLFFLSSILIAFVINKFSKKLFFGLLVDSDFNKPQAFHKNAVSRSGGFLMIILLTLFTIFYYGYFNYFLKEYLILSIAFFGFGFLDDLKININPNVRLLLMVIIVSILIKYFSIEINRTGLSFLNHWLKNNIFQMIFVILCFLFIINGSNLVDGFNGLLGVHSLIILITYLSINIFNNNLSLAIILFGQIIIILVFLFFNFPNSRIFLGDSGSYLIGALLAYNTIKTYELNVLISPFFFSSILFYLFFEVFFSFTRKIYLKKSPLRPDRKHLHMLIYILISQKKILKSKLNYYTSIIINFLYFIFIIPLFFFRESNLFCKYYFLFLIFAYLVIYSKLKKKIYIR